MYLKSIEIQGFKSFANKIEFSFKGGITGIVGPNGSGKSNVADAVRWVLGEQSARELRGASMQDVIFSGTETRKPMGYAYVAITLDNSDHALNVEYDEVTVARRVYRSGESEYLMNGNNCRLRDVQELFYDTGIGQEGYSIIGQGQIDKILSGKMDERRELFDEAAGIVKFKRRKSAAQKKLADEKNNLVRVNDILSELEKQIEPLSKQADTARVYLKKKEELKELDVNVFLLETDRLDEMLADIEKKGNIAQNDLKEVTDSLEESRHVYEKGGTEIEELDHEIEAKRNEISDSTLFKGQIEGKINVLKEQINTLKVSDEHFINRIEDLKKEQERCTAELEKVRESKKEIDAQVDEGTKGLDSDRDELTKLDKEAFELESQIEENRRTVIDLLNRRSDINKDKATYGTRLEQANLKRAELSAQLLRSKSDEAEIEEDIQKGVAALDEVNEEIRKNDEELAKIEEKAGVLREEREKIDSKHRSLEITYHEKKSRLESLKNLAERYEGYGNAVKKTMEQKSKERGLCGVVADLIHVDAKYETAIETALGGNLQNIVTKDEETAKRMIRYLKDEHAGRATFLPLNAIQERELGYPEALDMPGAIGAADTLVTFDKQYEKVASSLLGNYLVVDTVDNALAIARKFKYKTRIVTLSGEALNPGGSISGGSFKNKGGLLGRSREIENFQKEIKDALKQIDECLAKMEDVQDSVRENNKLREETQNKQKEAELRRNTCALNLKNLEDKKKEISEGNGGVVRQNEEIAEYIRQLKERQEEIEGQLTESEENEKALVAKNEELTVAHEKKTGEASALRKKLSEADLSNASLLQKQGFAELEVKRLEDSLTRAKSELKQNQKNLDEDAKEVEAKQNEIKELEAKIESFGDNNDARHKELQELIQKKDELSKSREEIVSSREKLAEKKSGIEREIERLNGQKEKSEARQDYLSGYMWDEYQLTRSAAEELKNPEMTDLSKMKRETESVKSAIRNLGNVNVNAIEEFKNLDDRYSFMNEQRNDLVKAEEDLNNIIAELDESMKKQFAEKFTEIAKEYDVVFKELFGGGKGTLELVDPENLLETDIRIIAQPPGKKLQNMMQLSGGEKALSAISLLFAIQALKPSPFCLLDEIEAALDEANVDRFANYLTKLTEHTQFIVITHRRGTMMKSDRLYGVTMQEKGVSTQVNVDLTSDEYK
ncbi:condensin subunit Smc [Lachnospiraceae bacterium]|nr:condensin subunit Smc [Lachnospiraceae bacterium]